MDINYVGEHLWAGTLGNLLVILSFIAALFALVSYYKASTTSDSSWRPLGRLGFRLHSLATIMIFGLLLFMLANHYFEYHFIWQHTSNDMPMKFLMSSFWEGQEGSFLLWSFGHIALGNMLIWTAGKWENKVMTVFSSVQVFMSSMLLGVFILEHRIGSNPFTSLLRDHPDFARLPLFNSATYLEFLDGRGLNPLLQNYWMIIHPPTVLIGYSFALTPFAFAIAGLWKKDYHGWIKPALPWTYAGIGVLGVGVLMGGAWAYEALSFGGFWAWDPVENASLVPWLIWVGGAHLMLINKNKGTSLVATFSLICLTFILVLYSTFLTRSGVLGETSVHAFSDLGMSGQLLLYLFAYLIMSIALIAYRWKDFPKTKDDEALWSREFWIFVGALILTISAFQIAFSTSIPVINKVFGSNLAPPADPVAHYNSWQIPFGIVLLVLIGFTMHLKFKKTDFKKFLKSISLALALALILTLGIGYALQLGNIYYLLMLFTSQFAVLANADYLIRVLKGKSQKAGSTIAHIGFGTIMLGALISMSASEVISTNTSGVDVEQLGDEYSNNENILLMENDTLPMGEYHVVYRGREKEGIYIRFLVDYYLKEGNTYNKAFTLTPFVQLNERMGNVPEPDTKHFLINDVFTHVTYATLEIEKPSDKEDYKEIEKDFYTQGDTIFASNAILVLEKIYRGISDTTIEMTEKDIAITARIRAIDFNTKSHFISPVFVLKEASYIEPIEALNDQLGLKILFDKIDTETGKVQLTVSETKVAKKDFVILKAIKFPFINVLWLGCIIMMIGTALAVYTRVIANRRS